MSLINSQSDDCENATAPMIKIRKASSGDTPQLEKLFLEVRQATFTRENSNKFKLEDYRKSTEGETIFLAEKDNKQIIGFIRPLRKLASCQLQVINSCNEIKP